MTETSDNREHPPQDLEARACAWVITERGLSCPFEATYLLTEREEGYQVEGPGDFTPPEFPVCRVHLEPMVDHLLVGQPRTGQALPLTLEVL
jgi:hypothetical protein